MTSGGRARSSPSRPYRRVPRRRDTGARAFEQGADGSSEGGVCCSTQARARSTATTTTHVDLAPIRSDWDAHLGRMYRGSEPQGLGSWPPRVGRGPSSFSRTREVRCGERSAGPEAAGGWSLPREDGPRWSSGFVRPWSAASLGLGRRSDAAEEREARRSRALAVIQETAKRTRKPRRGSEASGGRHGDQGSSTTVACGTKTRGSRAL